MNLNDNPVFLTQKRLVHRGGVVAAILIAALVGLSLLAGHIAYLAQPLNFPDFRSPQDAGKMFYGWTIGVEILVLIVGSFSRISQTLGNERKAGLWDSNRLTPLKPWQLVVGYWFGAPLREFYMSVVLAGTGLAIVVLGRLPITLWLGSQLLVFSTALFFGLLALLVGLALQRPQNGLAFIVLFFFIQFPSFALPKMLLTNFLLPVYGIVTLFRDGQVDTYESPLQQWSGWPEIFGLPVPAILLSLLLQAAIGILIWRAVNRKAANPFAPAVARWEAVVLFALLVAVQHGLIWGIWRGQFSAVAPGKFHYDADPLLPVVHCGTLLLMAIVLGSVSLQPEMVRVKALRSGGAGPATPLSGSAAALALSLTAIAAVALFTQCAASMAVAWKAFVIATVNLADFALIFSLLLEFCRLRYRRRALGFVALWLFVLCILPFIMAGVFVNSSFARLSLLAPGAIALADPHSDEINTLFGIVIGHLGVAIVIFLGWKRLWNQLLATARA